MAALPHNVTLPSWTDANRACLAKELRRIRLLMRRRACWLRKGWREDALAANRGLVISDARADQLLADIDDSAERTFFRDDPESREVAGELNDLERELEHERHSLPSGGISSLAAMADMFGLGAFECDAVFMCFAVSEDREFATLCAYLQDDAAATRVTQDLLLAVLCADPAQRAAARALLAPAEPLRHFRLLRLSGETGLHARAVDIDERVADFLKGLNRPDERLAHLLRPVPRSTLRAAHESLVTSLVAWVQSRAHEPWPLFNLTGGTGTDKKGVAAEFCARLGLQLHVLEAGDVPSGEAERREFIHLLQREAILSRMALYVDVADVDAGERTAASAVRDFAERFLGLLFIAGRERWRVTREILQVPVPRLTAAAQREAWESLLANSRGIGPDEIAAIVQQFDFGSDAITGAMQAVANRARLQPGGGPYFQDVWQACREYASAQLGGLAERLVPGYSWDDIVLPHDVMQHVRELAGQVAARTRVYEQWGFAGPRLRGLGIAALFCGPSGTGKTMTAEILANHLGLDLYRIDLAGVVSKYIGETEKNLRSIFDAAEQSGAILFFDEADALFGKRTEVRDSHDRYANIEINYLLQRMEDYRGLAILCTNRRNSLDRAFMRRLRFLIEFPFPGAEDRRRIWQKMIPPGAPVGMLDFDVVAKLEVPGGNIRNIAINAAFLAANAGQPIETAHVLQAARREYGKIDKLLTTAEFGAHLRQAAP